MPLKSQAKYQAFGAFMRTRRELLYRSARDFNARVTSGVSYPQYSRYEAGEQLPSLAQALLLCNALQVPKLETLVEWNKAQLGEMEPDLAGPVLKQLNRLLADSRTSQNQDAPRPTISRPAASSFNVPLDQVVVFNRSHREVFSRDPLYRDLFTYINAFNPLKISDEELSRVFKTGLDKISEMLAHLVDLGVVLKSLESGSAAYTAAKRNYYFPDDADFFELRNSNLEHNFDQLMKRMSFQDLIEKKAFRGVITREFTQAQYQWVVEQSEKLLAQSVGLPEDEGGTAIYSVLTVVGERFRRDGK